MMNEIAAAWATWHSRHGGKLGPGPAFREAIEAALSVHKSEKIALCDATDEEINAEYQARFRKGTL